MKAGDAYIFIFVFSVLVLIIGVFSRLIKNKLFVSIPLISVFAGILVGPQLCNILNPGSWDESSAFMLEAARITLAISLMGVALRIPHSFLKINKLRIPVFLFALMLVMFLVSSGLAFLLLGTGFWMAVLIGAIITPTDPVVSSSIVTGTMAKKYIPADIRHLISSESGANDGLAVMFFLLPLLMIQNSASIAITEWLKVILWDVVIAGLIGVAIGWIAGKCFEKAEKRKWIDKPYFLGYSIAVSLLTLGITRWIDSNAVFAVFIAGVSFSLVIKGSERQEEEKVQEAINHFFVIPVFLLFGMVLPWESWLDQSLGFYILIPAILLLRRLPWLLIFGRTIPILDGRYERFFTGWFGPIGVAAIFYLSQASIQIGDHLIRNIGSAIIFASIILHGVTATPFTYLYRKFNQEKSGN